MDSVAASGATWEGRAAERVERRACAVCSRDGRSTADTCSCRTFQRCSIPRAGRRDTGMSHTNASQLRRHRGCRDGDASHNVVTPGPRRLQRPANDCLEGSRGVASSSLPIECPLSNPVTWRLLLCWACRDVATATGRLNKRCSAQQETQRDAARRQYPTRFRHVVARAFVTRARRAPSASAAASAAHPNRQAIAVVSHPRCAHSLVCGGRQGLTLVQF